MTGLQIPVHFGDVETTGRTHDMQTVRAGIASTELEQPTKPGPTDREREAVSHFFLAANPWSLMVSKVPTIIR